MHVHSVGYLTVIMDTPGSKTYRWRLYSLAQIANPARLSYG